jgi:membrane protease YdiL (CAAX protease family)
MSAFALLAPHTRSREMLVLFDMVFMFYSLISFIRVMSYTWRQALAGRLVDGLQSPMRLMVSGKTGAAFAVCVLVLLFAQSPLFMVLVAGGLSAFLIESRQTADKQFGLDRMSAVMVIKWSLFVCGALVFVELPLSDLVDRVMTAIHLPHPEQESVEIFRNFRQPGQIILFLVQAVLLSPLIEELFFRGFLLTFLKNYTSTWFAIVLSAGIFAFAHVNLGSALQLWALGIVLGVAYEHAGSLFLPIGIHACWNFLTALSLLLDRGII